MSEFKGTSGDWYIDNEEIYENEFGMLTTPICVNTKGRIIVGLCDVYGDNDESKANALLISKAPQMLEMLKVIIELSEDNLKNDTEFTLSEYYTEYEEAKQLIKEATEL